MEQSAVRQVLHNVFVGVFNEFAREWITAGHVAPQVHRLDKRQLQASAQAQVFIAKCRRDMNNPGTVFQRNKVAGNHPGSELVGVLQVRYRNAFGPGPLDEAPNLRSVLDRRIQGLISDPHQVLTLHGGGNPIFLTQI